MFLLLAHKHPQTGLQLMCDPSSTRRWSDGTGEGQSTTPGLLSELGGFRCGGEELFMPFKQTGHCACQPVHLHGLRLALPVLGPENPPARNGSNSRWVRLRDLGCAGVRRLGNALPARFAHVVCQHALMEIGGAHYMHSTLRSGTRFCASYTPQLCCALGTMRLELEMDRPK